MGFSTYWMTYKPGWGGGVGGAVVPLELVGFVFFLPPFPATPQACLAQSGERVAEACDGQSLDNPSLELSTTQKQV